MRLGAKFSLILAGSVLIAVAVTTYALTRSFTNDQESYLSDLQTHLALFAQREIHRQMETLRNDAEALLDGGPAGLDEWARILSPRPGLAVWKGERVLHRFGESAAHPSPPPPGTSDWALLPGNSAETLVWIGRYPDRVQLTGDLGTPFVRTMLEATSGADTQLVQRDGTVLAAIGRGTKPELGRSPEVLERIFRQPVGSPFTSRHRMGNGAEFLATSLLLDTTPPLLLMVSTPWSAIQAVIHRTYRKALWIVAFFFVLATGIGVLFASTLTRPLRVLDQHTWKVAGGRLDVKLTEESRRADEVGRLARSFNRMIEELRKVRGELRRKERLAALGQFSAGIAHEIKNPLGGILGQAQLAKRQLQRDTPDRSAALRALELVEEETRRANGIVTRLMKFARHDQAPRTDIDLAARVRKSLEIVLPWLSEAGISVEQRIVENAVICRADGDQIHEVLLNLIQNAAFAMKGSSLKQLAVALSTEEDQAVLEVRDTGSGISEEARQHLFEPFFTTKPPGEGTGLGLAMCHGIITTHQGSIHVDSAPGRGSRFTVRLPRIVGLRAAA